ncbi:MAG: prepilin-type N-terminal cleavage/methylation domain-containing protein [Kofleriaceae bacterium]
MRDRRDHRTQQGFTLIEMMITVAIIAVLAVVVVPQFTGESRKSRASTEVNAMFGELAIRQDQYRVENGVYLATAACPATPSATAQDASGCIAAGTDWAKLRVRLPSEKLRCSYVTTVGTTAGTNNPSGFTFTSPASAWYYIIATCNMDGTGGNSTYFISSTSSAIQKLNEGA